MPAIKGGSVKVKREKKEQDLDVTKTDGYKEAMEDIREGRVYHADSVEDMFEKILV